MKEYLAAEAYIHAWSVMLAGIAIGFLVCQLLQPQSKWFGILMFACVGTMALWFRWYGAPFILVKP